MILLIKAPGSSKSFQEAAKKNHGRNHGNNFVGILDETIISKKDIMKLTDL